MPAFEKHIALSIGTSVGLFTISTTSNSYVEPDFPSYVLIDTSKYTGGTYYYEAVIITSAATGYATLWNNTAAAAVSGAEITTTSTSVVRVRSGSLTLTSGNIFTDRIKNDGSNTTTFYGGRVVVEQNAETIVNTETQALVFAYNTQTTTSSSFTDIATIGMCFYLHTDANWDGTQTRYFEATMKTSAATGYANLSTVADSAVASSEVSTTSTSFIRVRSGAITLVNETVYKAMFKNDGTNTTSLNSARIIIQQSASPTKSEAYMPASFVTFAFSATAGTFGDTLGRFYYDSTKWTADTISWYAEYSRNSGTSSGVLEMYNITSAVRTIGSDVTTAVDTTRQRSGALTMPTTQNMTFRGDSQSNTIYPSVSHLIAVLVWTNKPSNFFLMF